jgi:predicted glycosyltransferase
MDIRRPLTVWIDLENSPHALFFEPVIRKLRGLGHEVVVTAREFCNTVALARARGLPVRVVGRGWDRSRNRWLKRCLNRMRTRQLQQFARGRHVDVAASHTSRTQADAAVALGIPTWTAVDYEHSDLRWFRHVQCLMTPRVLAVECLEKAGIPRRVVRRYDGLKEDVYLAGFRPLGNVRRGLGIPDDGILVTFRPFSESAHYGNDAAYAIERRLVQRLSSQEGVRIVVLPRTDAQRRRLASMTRGNGAVQICQSTLDGPAVMHASDLVVTGGGTMLREAAVLGVPAISYFTGSLGAVDAFLVRSGQLTLVRSTADAEDLPLLGRRHPTRPRANRAPLRQVVHAICETARGRVAGEEASPEAALSQQCS